MGPTVGQCLLLACLPIDRAVPGTKPQVLSMNECFPVTAAPGMAMFDPENTRLNAQMNRAAESLAITDGTQDPLINHTARLTSERSGCEGRAENQP